jgi:hypothetical protein
VTAARGAIPRTSPLAPSMPLGTSIATTGSCRSPIASMTARAIPSTGRARPAPKMASTTSPAPSSTTGASGSTAPGQRAAACAASPRSAATEPSSARRTGQPRSTSTRAATKPSPPLFPGPQSTATGCGGHRCETGSATLWPALSISSMPETPPTIVSRSASPICAGVSRACLRQPSGEVVIAEMWGACNPGGSPSLTSRPRIVTSTADGGCSSVG